MHQNFSAMKEHCPPEKLPSHHSPIAIRHSPFTNRQSPIAIRRRFGSAEASPSHDFRRLKLALSFFVTDYELKSVAWLVFDCLINYGLKPVS